jgi:hypothetical protein
MIRKLLFLLCAGSLSGCTPAEPPLAPTPPMGWNSYDAYGTYCHEQACYDNLKVFVEKFKPLGYDYFVIDGGWYIEYEFFSGTILPTADKGHNVNINEYGYFIPSKCYFPNGIKGIADECHKNGVKFGVHILRGMPRKAFELDTPVKGTTYTARDIANTNSVCPWNHRTYGIDTSKPGAQVYYDGWIQQLADWGIDFIKADDIVTYPDEIDAVLKAIKKCGRPIVLSLSPGQRVLGSEIKLYEKADMLRVTGDVWDTQYDINKCFDAWLTWQYVPVREGFWLDMDMIPFGELQVMLPKSIGGNVAITGTHRFDRLTVAQKETLITIRAMSASPLFMSGVLMTLDEDSLRLLTHQDMIACNQNGVMGHLAASAHGIQIWMVAEKGTEGKKGWIGIFNRTDEPKEEVRFLPGLLGLSEAAAYRLYSVWEDRLVKFDEHAILNIKPNGCLFIRYERLTEPTLPPASVRPQTL